MRLSSVFERLLPKQEAKFHWYAWTCSTIFAAYVGTFGTFTAMQFPERLLYWGFLIGVSLIVGYFTRWLMIRLCGGEGVLCDLAGTVLMSLTFGSGVCLFNAFTNGFYHLSLAFWLMHVSSVFMVCLAILGLRSYARFMINIYRGSAKAVAGDGEAVSAASADMAWVIAEDGAVEGADEELPAFVRRMDPLLGMTVKSVSAADHYLLVHTERGTQRILMRFRDALEELAELDGLQIHRSHWVARSAIAAMRRDGRRHVVVMCCGQELPVSRAYLPDLRTKGFIGDAVTDAIRETDVAWAQPPEDRQVEARGRRAP